MIYPEDEWKGIWDLYVTIILVYTCVMTPYHIAFEMGNEDGWWWSNVFIDICFGIDIILTFLTTFYD